MVALEPAPLAAHTASAGALAEHEPAARWELTGSSVESVRAGTTVTLPGLSAWLLLLDGELAVESWQAADVLTAGDAVYLGRAHAYRVVTTTPARLVLASVRQASGEPSLPERFIARDFADSNRGVTALVELCPVSTAHHLRHFAASYGELIAAAMRKQHLESVGDPGPDALPPEVGRVVAAVSRDPAHPWTLDELARIAHLSRSSLGERFREALATSPLQYVREARMQRARQLLADADHSITHVAFAVGYGSVAAFSRAFTSAHGATPRCWRAGSCRPSAQAREPGRADHREGRAGQEHRRQACPVEQPAA
ncbi:helix-turn-helix domain-containing protein [Isoptericola croceus]|uniref:helix-turn-helix domain-containing protein n=1 Tax=Isoptericola croceus TaxID=3031406 RepID=UPI0023F8D37B|nr:AraC family transcriptional regulator [Isoptericola croceus]